MTGFEVLANLTYQPMVIFTTAYEEYAINAFDAYSVDYLVKPFHPNRFKIAMEKLEKFGNQKPNYSIGTLAAAFVQKKAVKQPFSSPIKMGDRILLIDYEDISHFQAEDKYVRVFTEKGKSYLSDGSLSKLYAFKLRASYIKCFF